MQRATPGINIARNIILVMMFSGALAGLAGMSEISGVVHRLQERISPGYGFTGIIVAWLAKLNPFGVILVSILFGALIVAGREVQPSGISQMIQGFVLFAVISSDVLLRYKVRLVRTKRISKQQEKWQRAALNFEIILHAGLGNGTILLFASIGEILAERAGVLNLGVEGMMLMGAMTGFSVALATGNPWLGLLAAMLAAGVLSLAHGVVTIRFQADQVVSGLALTFLGTGLALVLGNGLTGAECRLIPNMTLPVWPRSRCSARFSLRSQPAGLHRLSLCAPDLVLHRQDPARACTCAPWARSPWPPIRWASTSTGCAISTSLSAAVWPGWPAQPSACPFRRAGTAQTTSGQGWIAIGLVIFAQWNPLRAALGAYLFGALRRLPFWTCRGRACCWASPTRSLSTPTLASSCRWLPYLLDHYGAGDRLARGNMRKRLGAPAALGEPYMRGEHDVVWIHLPMLPLSHVAYTWLALSVAQDAFGIAPEADYRMIGLAAMGPDLIDKPLATAYFYRKYKSAVLFAHTLLANLFVLWFTVARIPRIWVYSAAWLGHALLDRLWHLSRHLLLAAARLAFSRVGQAGLRAERDRQSLLARVHPAQGSVGLGTGRVAGAGDLCLAAPPLSPRQAA